MKKYSSGIVRGERIENTVAPQEADDEARNFLNISRETSRPGIASSVRIAPTPKSQLFGAVLVATHKTSAHKDAEQASERSAGKNFPSMLQELLFGKGITQPRHRPISLATCATSRPSVSCRKVPSRVDWPMLCTTSLVRPYAITCPFRIMISCEQIFSTTSNT